MANYMSVLITVVNTLLSSITLIILNEDYVKETPLIVPEEIKTFGYSAETHFVTTEDGYILSLHRIPDSPKFRGDLKKPVVLLYHGFLCSSGVWIFNGPKNGLGYLLADLGYDVWMGNIRGNTYSRNHTRLNPDKDKAFWEFSFHEQGMYDLPAAVDFILELTGQPNLIYVGHSQGTSQFYAMASQKPEYNDKIRAMFSLAPVTALTGIESPIAQMLLSLNLTYKQWQDTLGVRELLRYSSQYINIGNAFCVKSSRLMQLVCELGLFLFVGFDSEQQNLALIFPEITKHTPAGASSKQALHFLQCAMSGKFQQYDYGRKENLRRYATEEPPEYNISKITAPVALLYSNNDWVVPVETVELLYKKLRNPIGLFLIPFWKFNHLDYHFAADVKSILYDQLIDLIKKY